MPKDVIHIKKDAKDCKIPLNLSTRSFFRMYNGPYVIPLHVNTFILEGIELVKFDKCFLLNEFHLFKIFFCCFLSPVPPSASYNKLYSL